MLPPPKKPLYFFFLQENKLFVTFIKKCLTLRHGQKSSSLPFSVWKQSKWVSVRHEKKALWCLKTMHPCPFVKKEIHSSSQFILTTPLPPVCLKQNVSPSPNHAHAKKSSTLKHVKNAPHCLKLILYAPKFNCFITCIKNVWQWGIKKTCPFRCLKKKSNKAWTNVSPPPLQCLKTMPPPPSWPTRNPPSHFFWLSHQY